MKEGKAVPFQISLASARVNAEMTQEEVAKYMHVGKQTVVSWEKGTSEPKMSQGRELSKLYGIPIDYIFLPKKSKMDFCNSEVRKTKYIHIPGFVIVGVLVLEIYTLIKSWKDIKEEDPLKEIKRDLLIQKTLIYAIVMTIFLSGTFNFGN